jgi:hypothetical protein
MKTINKTFLIFLLLFITINAHAQKWQWAHSDGNSGGTPPDYGSYVLAGNDDNIYLLGTYWYLIQAGQPANGYQFIKEWTKDGQFKSSVSMRKGNTYNSGASIQNFIKDNGSNTFLSGRVIDQYAFDTIQVSGGTGGYIAKFNNDNRCAWVKTGLANDVKAVAFDDKNSMYIVGPMYGTVYIDTFELQNTGNGSLYVAKLDSNANCLWVKQSFRGSYEFKQTLVSGKYIYTRGYIVDTCIVLDNISYCPNDYFVMQLDTLGNVQWLNPFKKLSGTGGYAGIGVDKNSNCYVAGSFTGIVSLGSDTLYRKIGTWVSFLAKYKPDGNVAWHKEITSDSSVIITHIHTNDAGYTYITGRFAGRTIFGKDTVTAKPIFDLSRTLECNMFIARYDANGNCLGVKTVYNAVATHITTDDSGNAIVTGSIHPGTTYFDAIQRTSNGGDDYFVAKLSAITGGNSSIKTPVVDNKLMIYANPNRGNFTIDVPKSIVTNTTAHLQIYNTAGSLIKDETVDISGTKINVDLGTVLKGLYTVSLSGNTFKTFTGKVMVE